jgi:hypothetical protein
MGHRQYAAIKPRQHKPIISRPRHDRLHIGEINVDTEKHHQQRGQQEDIRFDYGHRLFYLLATNAKTPKHPILLRIQRTVLINHYNQYICYSQLSFLFKISYNCLMAALPFEKISRDSKNT